MNDHDDIQQLKEAILAKRNRLLHAPLSGDYSYYQDAFAEDSAIFTTPSIYEWLMMNDPIPKEIQQQSLDLQFCRIALLKEEIFSLLNELLRKFENDTGFSKEIKMLKHQLLCAQNKNKMNVFISNSALETKLLHAIRADERLQNTCYDDLNNLYIKRNQLKYAVEVASLTPEKQRQLRDLLVACWILITLGLIAAAIFFPPIAVVFLFYAPTSVIFLVNVVASKNPNGRWNMKDNALMRVLARDYHKDMLDDDMDEKQSLDLKEMGEINQNASKKNNTEPNAYENYYDPKLFESLSAKEDIPKRDHIHPKPPKTS